MRYQTLRRLSQLFGLGFEFCVNSAEQLDLCYTIIVLLLERAVLLKLFTAAYPSLPLRPQSHLFYNPKSEKVGTVWKTQIKKESSDF